MLLVCSWNNEKRKFSIIWIRMILVLAVTRTVAQSFEPLHPSSSVCKIQTTTLTCNVKDNKKYRLESIKWDTFHEVIINNASHLILEEPLCTDQIKKVKVYYADQVTTEQGDENCYQQLYLYNSLHVTIEEGVNLLQMFSSEARKVILPLGSFHLTDTQVGEANLTVDNGKSIMTSSTTIQVVKGLVVKGLAVLSMENTSLGRLEGFIYDSDQHGELKDVTVDSVASYGFQVVRGILKLDNVFIKNIASFGLLVVQDAKLILQHCVIETAVYESILISDGGTIIFKNVTISQDHKVFFTLSSAFGKLYPLAFLENRSISTSGWIAIAVFTGATVGAAAGFTLMIVVQRRFKSSRSKTDTTNHTEQTTSQSALSPNSYKHMDQFTPTPSRPNKADREQQVDAMQGPSIELAPRAPISQRPQVPLPHGSSALTMTAQNLSKSSTVNEYLNSKDRDERDVLPLPPPPPLPAEDEELYDDVQAASSPEGKIFPLPSEVPNLPRFYKK
ncbi:hypothetical protein O3P69_017578 [Scylla paramamosain]|uniref:Uncharacterized protein n=1 Tax=Scylla paramamosain TaxID=85552 RepID=A0AAW0TXQ4_SCYPA